MSSRFGSLNLKEKLSNSVFVGTGGRFRTGAGSSPCAFQASRRESRAFVSSGRFLGKTVNSNRNG